jgi:hypothetical protein
MRKETTSKHGVAEKGHFHQSVSELVSRKEPSEEASARSLRAPHIPSSLPAHALLSGPADGAGRGCNDVRAGRRFHGAHYRQLAGPKAGITHKYQGNGQIIGLAREGV